MLDAALILISSLILYIIGYPLYEWASTKKQEEEEKRWRS